MFTFSTIRKVVFGLLISLAAGISCAQTAATPPMDIDATVEAGISTAFPAPTATPVPDVNATIAAELHATLTAKPTPEAEEENEPALAIAPTLETIVDRVAPSVVRIVTDQGAGSGFIFQMGYPTPRVGETALLVTNYHVIEDANIIDVTVNDSKVFTGKIVGIDPTYDLAALSICCAQLVPLEIFGVVDPPEGSKTFAFGYPLDNIGGASVTEGTLSDIRYDDGQWVIETESAINNGNSGGPLLSSSGDLIGMNRTPYGSNGQPIDGIGLAVSQRTLRQRIPDLISGTLRATPTPAPTPTPVPLSGFLEGQRLYDLGLFDSALVEFNQAISDSQGDDDAFAWRGRTYYELARYQMAVEDLNQALYLNPLNLDFYRWRGDAYIGLNIFTSAVYDFDQVIARDPNPEAADYHSRATAHFMDGQYFRAIDDLTQAIMLLPTAARFEFRGESYFSAAAGVLMDQYQKAVSDFGQAIKLEPTGTRYQRRGDAYSKLGMSSEANSDWNKACTLDKQWCP